jgi:hypothetical protein
MLLIASLVIAKVAAPAGAERHYPSPLWRRQSWRGPGDQRVDPPGCKSSLEPSALHRLGGEGAGVLVALAAHFSHSGTSDALLRRFGAISTLKGLQYWSVTEGGWRTLITDAAALTGGPDLDHRRPDFTLAEMRSGGSFISRKATIAPAARSSTVCACGK